MRRLTYLSLAVTALLQGAACGEDAAPGDATTGGAGAADATTTTTSGGGSTGGGEGGQGGGTGTGGGGATGGGGTGGAGTGGAGGMGGAGTGGAGGTGGATTYGYCAKGCTMPADCCPPGQGNCPSDSYPTNYTCDEKGICGAPQCVSHDDCTNGGANPNKRCAASGGVRQCVTPCSVDTDCSGRAKCVGVDDVGNTFCRIESEPFVCTSTEECGGSGKCVEGACACESNDDCTASSANACVL
ncbi:hypothetical protein WME98_46135 [Sorangium sp. So ce296]|uniref:hypothetical protein n=1 Tax=Sorangium sp. So ce296 TaxID=3133296 RepID=UPI003F5D876A